MKSLPNAFFTDATLAVFIATINELEFFPGVGSIGFSRGAEFVRLLRASQPTSIPLALTLISVISIEIAGVAAVAFFKYGGNFSTFPLN